MGEGGFICFFIVMAFGLPPLPHVKSIQEAQRKMSQLKSLMGKGVLTNGRQTSFLEQALGGGPTLSASPPLVGGAIPDGYHTYLAQQKQQLLLPQQHTFFTTFMNLEEKLLLKVRGGGAF